MKTKSTYVPDIDVAKLANAKTHFLFIIILYEYCPLILIRKIRFTYKVYNR